ncbi:MAG: hypothetical protein DMG76_35565 [Acidobacteria bacterium]|nr:MAG: hypothetical protein DMG76_35565 [Acidobacteriota bacterium]
MRSQRLWTPLIWNTLLPIVQGRARRRLRGGSQPYRRRSVISQEYLTRWIAHLRTSIPRQRCWTCLTCRTANLKPSNVILSSAFGNSKCYLMRLRITLKRSIRQQEDILSPAIPMCGRYRLSRRKQLVEEYFDCGSDETDWSPRYNIAPTQPVPVIRQNAKEPVRELSMMRWGLIPS